jgi:hypothetical protein
MLLANPAARSNGSLSARTSQKKAAKARQKTNSMLKNLNRASASTLVPYNAKSLTEISGRNRESFFFFFGQDALLTEGQGTKRKFFNAFSG